MKTRSLLGCCCVVVCMCLTNSVWGQPVPGCSRPADEASRVETARAILKVDRNDYDEVINYWAEDAIYKETVVTNHGRQEMWEYLSAVFNHSESFVMSTASRFRSTP